MCVRGGGKVVLGPGGVGLGVGVSDVPNAAATADNRERSLGDTAAVSAVSPSAAACSAAALRTAAAASAAADIGSKGLDMEVRESSPLLTGYWPLHGERTDGCHVREA